VWNIWIVYPVLGLGAPLAVRGWMTYRRTPISEDEIEHEMWRQAGVPH
jgi:hypothetical protein